LIFNPPGSGRATRREHHAQRIDQDPEGTAAYGMGFRFVSVPLDEVDYYCSNGATLAD
jgi:hypothetical protein